MDKESIVILHGWQSKIERWQPLVNLLKKKYLVFLPLLPGFGKKKLKRSWQLNDYVSWFKNYLKRNKIKNPILVAHSNGGRIAVRAISQKLRIKKLILIAPAIVPSKEKFVKIFYWLIAKIGKLFFSLPLLSFFKQPATWLFYSLIGEKDYFQAKGFLKPTLVNLVNENLINDLTKIKIPVLILWGKQDKLTPVFQVFILKKKIKRARLIFFKKAGHDLPFKLPEKLAIKIFKFLKG